MNDNPLTARQLEQIRNEAAAALQAAVDKMQLRKWAVEQALENGYSHQELMTIAQAIYDFVSQAAVVKVDIGQ